MVSRWLTVLAGLIADRRPPKDNAEKSDRSYPKLVTTDVPYERPDHDLPHLWSSGADAVADENVPIPQ